MSIYICIYMSIYSNVCHFTIQFIHFSLISIARFTINTFIKKLYRNLDVDLKTP